MGRGRLSRQHFQIGNRLLTGGNFLEAMEAYLLTEDFELMATLLQEGQSNSIVFERISGKEYHERLQSKRGTIQ